MSKVGQIRERYLFEHGHDDGEWALNIYYSFLWLYRGVSEYAWRRSVSRIRLVE
jgi:hypothetical protein